MVLDKFSASTLNNLIRDNMNFTRSNLSALKKHHILTDISFFYIPIIDNISLLVF